MKAQHILWSVTLGIAMAAVAGCGKKEAEPVTPPPPPPQASSTAPVTDMAKPAVDTAAVDAAAKAAADETAKTAAQANEKVTGIIDTVKKLVSENKYQEALQALSGLAQLNLTAEQQKLVDGLNDQITKAMAQKAAGDAVGGLLKKP